MCWKLSSLFFLLAFSAAGANSFFSGGFGGDGGGGGGGPNMAPDAGGPGRASATIWPRRRRLPAKFVWAKSHRLEEGQRLAFRRLPKKCEN
uniref:Secreted protein n=1 Tax=Globodera rostochiensis TaxID=31243 RepID=A0A914GR46_GLORO